MEGTPAPKKFEATWETQVFCDTCKEESLLAYVKKEERGAG